MKSGTRQHLAGRHFPVVAVRFTGVLVHGNRRGIVQPFEGFQRRNAVDGRVVHLQQDRETAAWQELDVVQPFDHGGLPQRSRAVDGARVNPRRHDAELAPVTRFGQCHVVHVRLDVEMLVVHPVGIVQPERYLLHTAMQERHLVGTLGEDVHDVAQAHPSVPRGLLGIEQQRAQVRRGARVLLGEEQPVQGTQLTHLHLPLSWALATPRDFPPAGSRRD